MANRRHLAVFGCGHDGRLGLGSSDENVLIPTVASYFVENRSLVGSILSVHVGGYHTFVRTSEGVYGFGANDEGQLGTGEKTMSYKQPTRIDFFGDGSDILSIACGSLHTVALMRNGLFACGSNTYGQLGLGDSDSRSHFSKVESSFFIGVEDAGLSYDNLVSHISCGTFHTLVAVKRTLISLDLVCQPEEGTICASQRQCGSDSSVQELIFYPCAVLACGKGDFGELGYNSTAWDEMMAREQRLKNVIKSRAHDISQGAAPDATLASAQNEAMTDGFPMKKPFNFKKPPKVRRAEFFHPHLRLCNFPLLDEHARNLSELGTDDQQNEGNHVRIISLTASHLHSCVVVEVRCAATLMPRVETYHFGCYYCDDIEGDESSIPRLVESKHIPPLCGGSNDASTVVAWHAHGGDEAFFVFCTSDVSPGSVSALNVLGKGIIGRNDEDSFEPSLVSLILPPSDVSSSLCVSGRHHYLIWRRGTGETLDEVFAFGDSTFGQCGVAGVTEEVILTPTLILKTGDFLPLAAPPKRGPEKPVGIPLLSCISIGRIVDVQCGSKHSVILFESPE